MGMALKKKTTRIRMRTNAGGWSLFFHALDHDAQGRTRYVATITTRVNQRSVAARVYLFQVDLPLDNDGREVETVWTFCVVSSDRKLLLPAGLFHIHDRGKAINVASKVIKRGFK
jgi:hypothetical protein